MSTDGDIFNNKLATKSYFSLTLKLANESQQIFHLTEDKFCIDIFNVNFVSQKSKHFILKLQNNFGFIILNWHSKMEQNIQK